MFKQVRALFLQAAEAGPLGSLILLIIHFNGSMFRKLSFLLLCMTTVAAGTHAQKATLVETVVRTPAPDDLTINYKRYKLSNGLNVIIHEDHSDPIVMVDVTYHVGSAREEIGKSGFAHFFEHMMFQGSKHVGDDEHFKIVSGAGGTMNGTTNRDRTNYFELLPKNYLETALWLEADRMGFLLEAVSQKKFEVQRATVKNEKGQNYENRPYGMTEEVKNRVLYPFGHPYSWPTIGYVPDLDAVGVEDLKLFFLRWYGPNNAVLTIGGDVNPAEVIELVEKYFGSIPEGPAVVNQLPTYFKLDKNLYTHYEDNVRAPRLSIVFPSVPTYSEDEAALDILADILGGGKSSYLYQKFVKTGKAQFAVAMNPTAELAGEFSFIIQPNPGVSLTEMEKLWRETMADFEKNGFTEQELDEQKGIQYAQHLRGLESVSGKVSTLAQYFTFTGNANMVMKDMSRYKTVTKADVLRVYNTYIKGQNALFVSVVPKGATNLIAGKDNAVFGGDTAATKLIKAETLSPREVKDKFDRRKKPKVGPSPVVSVPDFTKADGPGGVTLITSANSEMPLASVRLSFKGGKLYEPKGKEGIAYMATQVLQGSTKGQTEEQISRTLNRLGAKVNIYVTDENLVADVNLLSDNMMPTLSIVNNMLQNSKFDTAEFERIKKQQLESINNMQVQAAPLANAAFYKLLYGEHHPLGTPTLGTMESVSSITLEDVKAYIKKFITGQSLVVSYAGKLENHNRHILPAVYGSFLPGDQVALNLPPIPARSKTKIYLINKDKAPQSEIRVGYVSLPYDATGEFYKASIMNYVLGGAFNSHINMNLREDKGWTYGARSFFTGGKTNGPWMVSTGVRADATAEAVQEIIKEIENYRKKGITKDELKFTKSSILEQEALKYETNSQKLVFLDRIVKYDLDKTYPQQQANILKRMKTKTIKGLAKEYLPLEEMVILVVGDAETLGPKLQALGYEVVKP